VEVLYGFIFFVFSFALLGALWGVFVSHSRWLWTRKTRLALGKKKRVYNKERDLQRNWGRGVGRERKMMGSGSTFSSLLLN
jgi:hypothetical protein